MHPTYEGTLNGNQIDWCGEAPKSEKALRVQITVLDEDVPSEHRGQRMAEALERLAGSDAFREIDDASQWQREVRRDRSLPGRETE